MNEQIPQQVNPYPIYQDYYNNDSNGESSLVNQTNPKEVLFLIEMALAGKKEMLNAEGRKEWVIPVGCKPIVNQFGINSLMVDARSIINQNTILSNLTDQQISNIILRFGRMLKNKIKMRYKEFGIDKSNLDTALFSPCFAAYSALYRAKAEGEKKFLKTSVRAVESYVTNQKPQQSGNDKIKFWRD